MTRETANTKICPIMTTHNMNIAPTYNPASMMKEPIMFEGHAFCQTVTCMAWEEDKNQNGYCKLIETKTQDF